MAEVEKKEGMIILQIRTYDYSSYRSPLLRFVFKVTAQLILISCTLSWLGEAIMKPVIESTGLVARQGGSYRRAIVQCVLQ